MFSLTTGYITTIYLAKTWPGINKGYDKIFEVETTRMNKFNKFRPELKNYLKKHSQHFKPRHFKTNEGGLNAPDQMKPILILLDESEDEEKDIVQNYNHQPKPGICTKTTSEILRENEINKLRKPKKVRHVIVPDEMYLDMTVIDQNTTEDIQKSFQKISITIITKI